jgi:hypothetical protein
MRLSVLMVGIFIVSLSLVSCGRDSVYRVSSLSGGDVIVAQEKDTMESIIDCAIARRCKDVSVMEMLRNGKVFRVDPGTRVVTMERFAFSEARKVRVLEGDGSGRSGWVFDRVLVADEPGTIVNRATASLGATSRPSLKQ